MKSANKKGLSFSTKFSVLSTLVLAIGVTAAVFLSQQNQDQRSKASSDTVPFKIVTGAGCYRIVPTTDISGLSYNYNGTSYSPSECFKFTDGNHLVTIPYGTSFFTIRFVKGNGNILSGRECTENSLFVLIGNGNILNKGSVDYLFGNGNVLQKGGAYSVNGKGNVLRGTACSLPAWPPIEASSENEMPFTIAETNGCFKISPLSNASEVEYKYNGTEYDSSACFNFSNGTNIVQVNSAQSPFTIKVIKGNGNITNGRECTENSLFVLIGNGNILNKGSVDYLFGNGNILQKGGAYSVNGKGNVLRGTACPFPVFEIPQ